MKVDRITATKESEVSTIFMKPEDVADLEKEHYHSVYVLLQFNKEGGVNIKEENIDMGEDPDREYMKDIRLDDESEHHWRMIFEFKNVGIDYEKAPLHAKI